MASTMAEELRAEGRILCSWRVLLIQLRSRFGELPYATEAAIKNGNDIDKLDEWALRFVTAATLEDVGIPWAS